MDFQSLNRRELQFLCKHNKIPANMTNIAMADALKSLETVEGIEELLNPETAGSSIESPEKIEITSPRVPRTSCRTSTRQKVKKPEAESQPATASRTTARGVRRQLGGDVNEYLKTPSAFSTRKKAPITCSRQNVLSQLNECEEDVKKETTVQRVYSTRRSTRLTEKKCAEAGAIQREKPQPVKIDSFLEEVIVTSDDDLSKLVSEKSVVSVSDCVETSHESDVSSKDTIGEESVSKAKVEDICNAFEKLDVVVVDESDPKVVLKDVEIIEKHENVDLEEKYNVVIEIEELSKPDVEDVSYPCEDSDEESDEKIDPNESLNQSEPKLDEKIYLNEELHVSVKEQKVDSDENPIKQDMFEAVSEMKNVNLECNGFTNMVEDLNTENPSEVSKFDKEITADAMEENISISTDNANEQDTNMDSDTEEEQESEIAADINPTKFEEYESAADVSFIKEENQISTDLSSINQQTENDEMVEDDKNVNEKPKSLIDISIRQLKKQLKAMSIKSDTKVAEARTALQAVCDNQLVTGDDN